KLRRRSLAARDLDLPARSSPARFRTVTSGGSGPLVGIGSIWRRSGERPWRARRAQPHSRRMRFAIVAHTATETTRALTVPRLAGVEPTRLSPGRALAQLEPGDVALARIDVLPSVDGIEPGLWALDELAARGVDVLNGADALRAAHDKLLTAAVLAEACLPHPLTAQL